MIWSGITGEIMLVFQLFRFIAGWFYRSNFWMAFIYVAIVFIVVYFLDMFATQKDVAYINEKIKERDKL